jgi:hypothetical protein
LEALNTEQTVNLAGLLVLLYILTSECKAGTSVAALLPTAAHIPVDAFLTFVGNNSEA